MLPPQKSKRRIIHKQLSHPPQPLEFESELLPQQRRIKIKNKQLLFPPSLELEQELLQQFVAVKSLINEPPNNNYNTILCGNYYLVTKK